MHPHKHRWEIVWTNGFRWIYRCWWRDVHHNRCNEIGYGVSR